MECKINKSIMKNVLNKEVYPTCIQFLCNRQWRGVGAAGETGNFKHEK